MRRRSEKEMYELILGVAEADVRIRVVGLNGSRANPAAPRDEFQDFDVVYLVTDTEPFMRDYGWVDVFSERVIMQLPQLGLILPPDPGNWFAYLMQFTDGNRIDLTIRHLDELNMYLAEDSLTKILLDKDSLCAGIPAPSDRKYHVKPPTTDNFRGCCNEFWWVSLYAAKGIFRHELLYATEHIGIYMRDMLMHMLSWQVGCENRFSVSVGKSYKYIERRLPRETWLRLVSTHDLGGYDSCIRAIYTMIALFRESAAAVAGALGFEYDRDEDEKSSACLEKMLDGFEHELS